MNEQKHWKNYKDEQRYENIDGYEIAIVDLDRNEYLVGFWIKFQEDWLCLSEYPVCHYSLDDVGEQIKSRKLKKFLKGDKDYPANYAAKVVRISKTFNFIG